MNNFENILISPHSTIRQALEIIDKGAMKIALVVDEQQKLLGTLSDGDVRRAILKGINLDESVSASYFRAPITCTMNQSRDDILQLAATHKLFQIPIVDYEGRVVGIEEVTEFLRSTHHENTVVLMVGGLGERLQPLTDTLPKSMLQVGNRPILETIIQNFSKYGYTNIILSVSYKAHIIEDYFGNGSAFGVDIQYVHESKRMGTAGALSLIKQAIANPFFVMNGDVLTNINFEHMCDFHLSHNAIATMAVREYDFQVPYGVVDTNASQITSITEKPVHKFFVNAGIYMLSPQVLSYVPQASYFDMPTLFEMLIAEQQRVVSFPLREYWLDIGRISDYEKANVEYSEIFENAN